LTFFLSPFSVSLDSFFSNGFIDSIQELCISGHALTSLNNLFACRLSNLTSLDLSSNRIESLDDLNAVKCFQSLPALVCVSNSFFFFFLFFVVVVISTLLCAGKIGSLWQSAQQAAFADISHELLEFTRSSIV
jgi:hypothetical protein